MALSGIRNPATNTVYISVFPVRYIASALIAKETALLTFPPLLRRVFVVLETSLSSRCLATAIFSGSTITTFSHYIKSIILYFPPTYVYPVDLFVFVVSPERSMHFFSLTCDVLVYMYKIFRRVYTAGNILSEEYLIFILINKTRRAITNSVGI